MCVCQECELWTQLILEGSSRARGRSRRGCSNRFVRVREVCVCVRTVCELQTCAMFEGSSSSSCREGQGRLQQQVREGILSRAPF
jgi:hypothetical protein